MGRGGHHHLWHDRRRPPFYAMYVALTKIMVSFSADVEQVQWVISAFDMAAAVMMPTIGWLGSVISYPRLYRAALSAYMLFALLAAPSWSIESLVAFRSPSPITAPSIAVGASRRRRAAPPLSPRRARAGHRDDG